METPAHATITVDTCAPDDAWDAFVKTHPRGTINHLACWASLLESTYGQEALYLAARREGALCGVLPLIHVRSSLFGSSLVSLPFHLGGGPLGEDAFVERLLVTRALDEAGRAGARRLILRTNEHDVEGFAVDRGKAQYTLDLARGPDATFKSFRKQNRTRIRKGERAGLHVRFGREGLDVFYRLLCMTMQHLGSLVTTKRLFEHLLPHFGADANVAVAYLDSRPVAAKLYIDALGKRHFFWGGHDRRYASCAPNYLLMWTCLLDATERGIQLADLGRSNRGSTHARTKLEWGAVESPLNYFFASPTGEAVQLVQATSPRYRRFMELWRRLPLFVTGLVGPRLHRQIP